jgi:hypothetical protein
VPRLTLVTGAARSGTTLTTAVLAAHGARLGPVNALNEHTGVREGVLKPLLRAAGADPRGQHPLPSLNNLPAAPDLRRDALAALGEANTYKDAKLCLTWRCWDRAFPDARWIVVRRDREGIVGSCLRTPFMRAYDTADDWRLWVDHHLAQFNAMRSAGLDMVEVWPDPADPESFRPAVEQAGLTFDAAKAAACVDPERWKASA